MGIFLHLVTEINLNRMVFLIILIKSAIIFIDISVGFIELKSDENVSLFYTTQREWDT